VVPHAAASNARTSGVRKRMAIISPREV
jgi:hypothetical protein